MIDNVNIGDMLRYKDDYCIISYIESSHGVITGVKILWLTTERYSGNQWYSLRDLNSFWSKVP